VLLPIANWKPSNPPVLGDDIGPQILAVYEDCSTAECLRVRCQNRSYVVRSTASFSVIEMPYKNLKTELPSNSTTVSMSVTWVIDTSQPVPGWVVALAVLSGLLLLALLIFIMYKVRLL
ncbi:hypothetical protein GOODEAATRI_001955, partial [Goodea atripinnis]